MPEAIATTKRRFEKVLDTLSNPPAAAPRAIEPAAKRVRRTVSGASSLPRTSPKADKTAVPPPNFSPWSHETFLARLQTFSNVSLWHPKPEPVNEVQWAKRGWICTDINTVACRGGCEKRVVVSLDPMQKYSWKNRELDDDERAAYEQSLVKRYASLIVEGHSAECYWRQAGCKDDIYRLQVVRPSIWHGELRKRYTSLLSIHPSIRNVNLEGLAQTESTSLSPDRLLEDLPREVLTLIDTQPQERSAKALEIALHGWRGSSDSGNDLLRCDACFQRVGLWMYQPDYKPSRATSSNRASPPSNGSDDDKEENEVATIDLLEMHRDHCPWRNPDTQKASGSLSGLNASQILHRVISNYARDHRRKENERLRAAQTPDATSEDLDDSNADVISLSREEVAQQDKERDSRLRRLKSLFTIKRRATSKPRPKSAAV